jgi:hypothetical protein
MPSFISSHAPDAAALALAIVDTVREPLLVLDKDLRVLAASRSFYLNSKSPRTRPKIGRFTTWATASGISRAFGAFGNDRSRA